MIEVKWPVALATVFVVLLGWYVYYTQQIVEALRADVQTLTEIFGVVQQGLTSEPGSGGEVSALFDLQGIVLRTGVPIVMTVPKQGPPGGDSVDSFENLPFEADIRTPEGQERVLRYVDRLDARHPPVGDSTTQHLHFGDTPEIRRLEWIPWLQVGGLLLTVFVGFTVIRAQRRAESEKAWTAMARELAHQLGTPISSLQGWLEVMRLERGEWPGDLDEDDVAEAIEEDLVRLERISHRFELIGREPELQELDLYGVVEGLERYLQARLPRFGPGVDLVMDVPRDLPPVCGNEVLLIWALENVVKNALDALAGTGGAITFEARREGRWVTLRIHDTGPGVEPEIRERLFEPGTTTKSGGWGVGLALTRRIVEGLHDGRIELLDSREGGATFQIRLPPAA